MKVSKNFKKATSFTQPYNGLRSSFNGYNEDDFGEGEIFGDHPRMGVRDKEVFLNPGPATAQVADSGTYFYPHPSAQQQYMMPYNPSMMYQSLPYQTPYNNSYSPVSTTSEFHDNQIVYYAAHQQYNYPQVGVRTFPHTNSDASPVPSALQTHLLYRNGECINTYLVLPVAFSILHQCA